MTETINRIVKAVQHMGTIDAKPLRVNLTIAAYEKLEREMSDAGSGLDQDLVEGWPETMVGLPFTTNPHLTHSAVVGTSSDVPGSRSGLIWFPDCRQNGRKIP